MSLIFEVTIARVSQRAVVGDLNVTPQEAGNTIHEYRADTITKH